MAAYNKILGIKKEKKKNIIKASGRSHRSVSNFHSVWPGQTQDAPSFSLQSPSNPLFSRNLQDHPLNILGLWDEPTPFSELSCLFPASCELPDSV